jgi:hypothetical protein
MSSNHQSVGGFLKSSTFSLIVYCNFLFTLIFLVSLSVQIARTKQQSAAASYSKEAKQLKSGMVTLAKVP